MSAECLCEEKGVKTMKGGKFLAVAVVALMMLSRGAVSLAADFKVGVIDQQVIMEKTKAGKRALEGIKEFSVSRQKIIASDDEALKELEKSLKAQESGLSEAARREKQEQFRTKLEAYQRRLQDYQREIQVKQKELFEEYSKKIDKAAKVIAEKEGYAAVLDRGNENTLRVVLYHRSVIDLTDQVVKEFDRQNK